MVGGMLHGVGDGESPGLERTVFTSAAGQVVTNCDGAPERDESTGEVRSDFGGVELNCPIGE